MAINARRSIICCLLISLVLARSLEDESTTTLTLTVICRYFNNLLTCEAWKLPLSQQTTDDVELLAHEEDRSKRRRTRYNKTSDLSSPKLGNITLLPLDLEICLFEARNTGIKYSPVQTVY